MAAFRDHLRLDGPSDDEVAAGVGRLLGDPETEFLLASTGDGAPAAAVAQLRFRYGIWRARGRCLLGGPYARPAAALPLGHMARRRRLPPRGPVRRRVGPRRRPGPRARGGDARSRPRAR